MSLLILSLVTVFPGEKTERKQFREYNSILLHLKNKPVQVFSEGVGMGRESFICYMSTNMDNLFEEEYL